MKIKYIALTAVFSTFLVGCGSSGGGSGSGGGGVTSSSSINGVPSEYRAAVQAAKTFNPIEVAQDNLEYEGFNVTKITINGKELPDGQYDFSRLNDGLSTLNFGFDISTLGQAIGTAKGKATIYQQPYSIVKSSQLSTIAGFDVSNENINYVDAIRGLNTTSENIAQLASEGAFTYNGVAFNGNETGNLSYTVDFGTREGSGMITGISETGAIEMEKARITRINDDNFEGMGIYGKAKFENNQTVNGLYVLGFFGPHAEEIAGGVSDYYEYFNEVGFGGKR